MILHRLCYRLRLLERKIRSFQLRVTILVYLELTKHITSSPESLHIQCHLNRLLEMSKLCSLLKITILMYLEMTRHIGSYLHILRR